MVDVSGILYTVYKSCGTPSRHPLFFVGGHHHGIHRTTHTIHTSLVNFHLGWFAKKTPHKSPKNCVFPLFYERFWDLWVFFLGTNPSGKLVHFLDFCIYFHHTYRYIRYIQCIHRGGRLFAQKAAFRNEDCHLEMVTFFQRFACCEVIVDGAGRMPGWSRTVELGVGLRDAWMVSPMGCQDGVPKKRDAWMVSPMGCQDGVPKKRDAWMVSPMGCQDGVPKK